MTAQASARPALSAAPCRRSPNQVKLQHPAALLRPVVVQCTLLWSRILGNHRLSRTRSQKMNSMNEDTDAAEADFCDNSRYNQNGHKEAAMHHEEDVVAADILKLQKEIAELEEQIEVAELQKEVAAMEADLRAAGMQVAEDIETPDSGLVHLIEQDGGDADVAAEDENIEEPIEPDKEALEEPAHDPEDVVVVEEEEQEVETKDTEAEEQNDDAERNDIAADGVKVSTEERRLNTGVDTGNEEGAITKKPMQEATLLQQGPAKRLVVTPSPGSRTWTGNSKDRRDLCKAFDVEECDMMPHRAPATDAVVHHASANSNRRLVTPGRSNRQKRKRIKGPTTLKQIHERNSRAASNFVNDIVGSPAGSDKTSKFLS